MNRYLATLSLAVLTSSGVRAQLPNYLDIFIVKVKPEKRVEFDAISRKMADANRKAKGDSWLAMQTEYGENNTVYFVSQRDSFAGIEQGFAAFEKAVNEIYGPGSAKKLETDFMATTVEARSEFRRRRWDLSINAPKDAEAYTKLVGEARWLRMRRIRIRTGHGSQFEEQIKQVKSVLEEKMPSWTILVSQSVAGEPEGTYYLTTLHSSLSAVDSAPNMQKLMGDEVFSEWEKKGSETVTSNEVTLHRFLPEISNPPEAVAKVAANFWMPKPLIAARPKSVAMAKSTQEKSNQ